MPVGVLINTAAIFLGGIVGALVRRGIPQRINDALTGVFGLSAITMGIYLIIQLSALSAVVMSIILGTLIGECFNIEHGLSRGLSRLPGDSLSEEQLDNIISMIILFCFSGTGLFGAMNSGLSGDHSILISKAIMDFFTAIIFGATSGYLVGVIAVPQMCIGTLLFFLGSLLMPLLNQQMVSDFKAVGGIITLAVGLKIAKIRYFRVINMVPALVLVFFISRWWLTLPV